MNYPISILTMRMPADARRLLTLRFSNSKLAYHNIDHIIHMLKLLAEHFADSLSAHDLWLLETAIWWHDYRYEADRDTRDNERKSADIANLILALSDDDAAVLDGLIMATAGAHIFSTRLEEILVALDLAILATPRPVYAKYALKIRREYHVYDDAEYRAGRIAVLDKLCERPILHILSVAMGFEPDELNHRAQANMRWEQAQLKLMGTVEDVLTLA
jgi:predicted metal-dependent HD superfamily phosphohydrolase